MKDFIKVTLTEEMDNREIWISKYQIVYMEDDKKHSQSIITLINAELKVKESVLEIIEKFKA